MLTLRYAFSLKECLQIVMSDVFTQNIVLYFWVCDNISVFLAIQSTCGSIFLRYTNWNPASSGDFL